MNRGKGAQRKAMDNASPVFWLRDFYLEDKSIPDLVRDRIARLYKEQPRHHVKGDIAVRAAIRLTCLINLARVEYALAKCGPEHRSYLARSKAAATWATMLVKFNKVKGNGEEPEQQKRKMPTTASSQEADDEHEDDADDAESAED